MDLQTLIAVLTVAFTSALFYLKWKSRYWKRRNVFTLPGNSLLTGKPTKSTGIQFQEIYNEVKRRGLRYGGHYSLTRPQFVPVDIDLVRRMLTTDFQHFTDHSGTPDVENDPLSGHLFLLTGAKWKALRIKLTPLFTSGKLKLMFDTLADCSRGLRTILDQAEKNATAVDIKDVFARYTTDVIASIGFGIECNCLKNPDAEFRKIGKLTRHSGKFGLLKHILRAAMPSLCKKLKFTITDKEVEKFIMKIVYETAVYRDKNNYRRKDFMQLLLDLRTQILKVDSTPDRDAQANESGGFYQNGLSMKEVAAQAYVFFVAGFETSSTTLNFLMYELATNPEIQERLRKEIIDVLEKHNWKVTYEAVSEVAYLERCILESLRKYPPLPVMLRQCTKTYNVPDSDLVINKDDSIIIPVYGIHHDPDFYPEPDKFEPDRFTEENKNARPQCSFLAFGDGPRICIGLRLGVLQTKVGLISMLRNFRFTLSPKTKTPIEFDPLHFVSHAKGGIWVQAHRV